MNDTIKSSHNTPLEIYHGVPKGWTKEEVLVEHQKLGGNFDIDCPIVTEPGTLSWLPDRCNWLQYKAILKKIAEGVRYSDEACIELAIRYIELNYFGSYSGFLREKLARSLKSQEISSKQKQRLTKHFQKLIDSNQCFHEFKEYKKLIKKIEKSYV